jgi:hypothetical protein
MRRLLAMIACLGLILSLGVGSMAHALEPPPCVGIADAELHWSGDADQLPSDADKGYPHHHGGCHGHHVAAPAESGGTAVMALPQVARDPCETTQPAGTGSLPGLRPPIA